MRQIDLISSPTPSAPTDESCERDLFGNPVASRGPSAPTYRPRKPVQQGLAFDTFTLGSK